VGNGATKSGYDVLRILLAVLLLIAAGLKAFQLATEPTVGTSILDARLLLMVTVEFELFFGLWLLANILAKPTWAATLTCFGLFTCVSFCKALAGYATCGCFGRVAVNPWYTGTLDVAVVLSLLRWRPSTVSPLPPGEGKGEGNGPAVPPSLRATAVLVTWLAIGLPAAYAMGNYTGTTLSDAGQVIGNGKVVVLEPEKWIGKRFPLLDYIDVGDKLKEGKWLVVLYHHDCPKCMEIIRHLRQIRRECGIQQIALIAMPPYDNARPKLALPFGLCMVGRLNYTKEWFATTPLMIVLDGAMMKEVRR
jgi:hypothetical protein